MNMITIVMRTSQFSLSKRLSLFLKNKRMFNVCIIGSGVAGLSTAGRLIKRHPNIIIDIMDKFPVPFGLIRYGVAPDHSGVKNCERHLSSVLESKNCKFIGNVTVGKDVQLSHLQKLYHAVVLSIGVQEPKKLNIPGEDLSGVYTARDFYSWYNGLPSHRNFKPKLCSEDVAIIGQGNVALDVARILLSSRKQLERTDICEHALKALQASCVRRVHLIGRSTALEINFSTREVRAMSNMKGCHFTCDQHHIQLIKQEIKGLPKPKQRLMNLLTSVTMPPDIHNKKEWNLCFMKTPKKIIADGTNHKVSGILLGLNKTQGDWRNGNIIETNDCEVLPCGMVLVSIGFHIPDVNVTLGLDSQSQNSINNRSGRVMDVRGSHIKGLYCSGWAKTGPHGGLQNTMESSCETADCIFEDFQRGNLRSGSSHDSATTVRELLHSHQVTSFSDWKLIDKVEKLRATLNGSAKPKEKITSFEDMLKIIKLWKTII